MAYHDTISPAQVLSNEISATRKVLDKMTGFFASMGQSVSKAALARGRFETIRTLQGMSDTQLASLNIKREDIVQHVLGDFYYS